jgi:hypothetical protein
VPSLLTLPMSGGRRRPRLDASLVLAAICLVGYLGVAAILVFGANVILGDALARVENVERVLYSRDPHLAATGFAWPPLPALTELPLVPLSAFWPPLVQLGFAANLMSATFMAGAVYQVHRWLLDVGLASVASLLLTALFAAHPMIVFYGANGMSEAPFLFFLLLATRHLSAWLETGQVLSGTLTGISLGCAYLCRYEAAAAGLAVLALVAVKAYVRAEGDRSRRFGIGCCDALVVGAPFLLAVASWAVASWLITGHVLDQFSSVYGTRSQMTETMGGAGQTLREMRRWAGVGIAGMLALQPALVVLAGLAAWLSVRHRELRLLSVLGVLGAVLAGMYLAYVMGVIPHTIRYLIVAVPLGTLLAGLIASSLWKARSMQARPWVAPRTQPRADRSSRLSLPGTHRLSRIAVVAATALLTALAWPTAVAGLLNETISPSFEAPALRPLLDPSHATAADRRAALRFKTDRYEARELDAMDLPRGAVLVDDFAGFAVVISSKRPDQFVITSDRDFTIALGDPVGFGIRYILVPEPVGRGVLDAINRTHPDIYESGGGIGVLAQEFHNSGDVGGDWRLFRVKR